MVTYMPSTPVHFPAQLAKQCGAVAGSASGSTGGAVVASTGGTVSAGISVFVAVSPGAGASAFSQPASSTKAVEAARVMCIFIVRLLPRSEEHTSELQ